MIRASSEAISFKEYSDSLDDFLAERPGRTSPRPHDWESETAARSPLEEANGRIRQSETFAWAVPGLAIAAEAFLLGAALSRNTTPRQQAVACFAGILTLVAALQFLAKHAFNFRVYEAVMERSREKLGLPLVTMRQLVGSATPEKENEAEQARVSAIRESFPEHVELVRDGWLEPTPGRWRWIRNLFARRVQSVRAWGFAIVVLIALDFWILIRAVLRIL